VRGKGYGVTPSSLKKNNPKTKSASNKELQARLDALEAEVLELRKEKARQYQSERESSGVKETSDIASVNCALKETIPEVNSYII
jgi:cell division septum initiation protein DivIVA